MFFEDRERGFRAGIVLAALAVVVIGQTIYQAWSESAGQEFARAARALAEVRSFRYEYADVPGSHVNWESFDIACPDRQRRVVTRVADGATFEYVRVGDAAYYHTPSSNGWRESDDLTGTMDLGILCEKLAAGAHTGPFPPYAMLLKRGFPVRGKIKPVNGIECREWNVKVPQMGIVDDSESFCLTLDSYLPVYRVTGSGRYSFSDYNAPIRIKTPRVTAAAY